MKVVRLIEMIFYLTHLPSFEDDGICHEPTELFCCATIEIRVSRKQKPSPFS